MILVIAGVLAWCAIHLSPAVAPALKVSLTAHLGGNGYKLAFTAVVLISLALIIIGWRSTTPEFLYHFTFARHATYLIMVVAIACLVAANTHSHLAKWLRHPQLTGVFLWSAAHLLANGDNRSLVLFGGFALWSVLEMLMINRRDGRRADRIIPEQKANLKVAVKTVVVVIVIVLIHPILSGIPLVRIF